MGDGLGSDEMRAANISLSDTRARWLALLPRQIQHYLRAIRRACLS